MDFDFNELSNYLYKKDANTSSDDDDDDDQANKLKREQKKNQLKKVHNAWHNRLNYDFHFRSAHAFHTLCPYNAIFIHTIAQALKQTNKHTTPSNIVFAAKKQQHGNTPSYILYSCVSEATFQTRQLIFILFYCYVIVISEGAIMQGNKHFGRKKPGKHKQTNGKNSATAATTAATTSKP